MHLLPSTNKYFKRTYRHFFKRRINHLDRPLIIITFQGVLGDFIKEWGISNKQDHLISKANQTVQEKYNVENPTSLWVRIGTIDGLKYLSKHFQIVIFNRDTTFEDHSITDKKEREAFVAEGTLTQPFGASLTFTPEQKAVFKKINIYIIFY